MTAAPAISLIYVCRTCDRYAPVRAGVPTAGEALVAAVRAELKNRPEAGLQLRQVACLGGCRNPCNAAFRGRGRYTCRFSRLIAADIPDLIGFGQRYWSAGAGEPVRGLISEALLRKLTVYTPPV